MFLVLKFPLIATEYYAYNSVSSVKLMTIIETRMRQNGKAKMLNFFFNYLRYRYNLNGSQSY